MNDGSGSMNGDRFGITEPAHHGDERTALVGFLQRQRDLIGWKLSGCGDEVLSRESTPTGMTLHGMVRHLTSAERYWFRIAFAGDSHVEPGWTSEDPDADWRVPQGMSINELLTEYTKEAALCDAIIAGAPSLDTVSAQRDVTLRWIVLHMIEETARHLGHVDVMRERADGTVGEEPSS